MNSNHPPTIKADFKPGDIFACWGADWISRFISAETSSPFGPSGLRWAPSHVAIACPRWAPYHNAGQFWFESTSMSPRECLEAGRPVRGVQAHTIPGRLADYLTAGGRIEVFRLTGLDELTQAETQQLRAMLGELIGDESENKLPVTYDTAGALLSGTRVIRRFSVWRNQMDSLFCSELIAALLQRLGRLCRRNPADFTPGRLLRALVSQGTYRHYQHFGPLKG